MTQPGDSDDLLHGVAARIEALAAATRALVGAIHVADETNTALAAAVERANTSQNALLARARIERSVAIAFASIFVVLLVMLGVGGGIVAYQLTRSIEATKNNSNALLVIAKVNQANSDTIKDCTSPGGVCYQRGQAQTAQAVNDIAARTLIASWCGAHSSTLAEARRCVAQNS